MPSSSIVLQLSDFIARWNSSSDACRNPTSQVGNHTIGKHSNCNKLIHTDLNRSGLASPRFFPGNNPPIFSSTTKLYTWIKTKSAQKTIVVTSVNMHSAFACCVHACMMWCTWKPGRLARKPSHSQTPTGVCMYIIRTCTCSGHASHKLHSDTD